MTTPGVYFARARNVAQLWSGGPSPVDGHRSAVADCGRLWPGLAERLDALVRASERDPADGLQDLGAAAAIVVREWSRVDSYRPRARTMIRIGWPLLWAALHDLAGHPAGGQP